MADSQLKQRTVKTLKWNAIDRVATQLLYAAVGIVLANILSKEDFGVVGIILAFQAFAIIFVDSGFGAALLQKKDPEETDYSTVFWFNLTLCALVYAVLWFCAPLIATTFGDARLTLICRVQFVAFILQGLGIVQTNRLMKRMDVRQIAIADTLGLVLSGCAAIVLAVKGFGVWALVWQYILLAAIRTLWLWLTGKWMPRAVSHRLAPTREAQSRYGVLIPTRSYLRNRHCNRWPPMHSIIMTPTAILLSMTYMNRIQCISTGSICLTPT